jgi:hypothetical protein
MSTVRIALAVGLALGLGVAVRAQFTVFDPTNYAQAVEQLAQLEQQYMQLVRTYELLVAQARRMPGDLSARYRGEPVPWLELTASDAFGVTGGWIHAANTGHEVEEGYRLATERLRTDDAAFDEALDPTLARTRRSHGGIELADGIAMHALEMVGHLRGHAQGVEFALRRLEDDSFAGDADLNTQVAVLNKINAASVTAARLVKDTNQILIGQLEQQLLETTRRRDAETQALNAELEWRRRAPDVLQPPIADTTDTLTGFRWPE